MSFIDSLRQASFRGVPFGVLTTESRVGRRQAVHEYPFRDTPYIEDIGRATRRISFAGFLITNSLIYGGGDVIAQREAMVAAAETLGSGELIHPTLGRLQVSLLDLIVAERWDNGRYFELGFSFLEAGQRVFPSLAVSTGDAVMSAAASADAAANADFVTRATADLRQGAAVVGQAVNTAATWARQAQRLGNDATNLYNLVGTLRGSYGRYFGGRNVGGLTGAFSAVTGTAGTVGSLINQGTVARAGIAGAANTLNSVAGSLGL